jgi:multidrug efflux pump
MMATLIDAILRRARTVLLILVLLLIAGTVAYREIPRESVPDIDMPVVHVSTTLQGIAPEDAERLLLRPLETRLRSVEGLKELKATAIPGGGDLILKFEAGFDADRALRDVRDRIDQAKPDLPAEADEPIVHKVNLSLFPVLVVILSGDLPERTLVQHARDLQDRLEAIGSVLEAQIAGDREEQIEIIIDPLLVESYGLQVTDVVRLFERSNRLVAAGTLDTGQGRFAIKVPGLFESLQDIWTMPVKVSGDAVVRFRDIAEVRRTFKDPETFARVDGKPAIALEISKRAGENIIDTIERVRQVVEAERATWPAAVTVTYAQDRSRSIRQFLSDLENNLAVTVLLVMVIVVASLGLRTATLVGVAVPGSFLAAILLLYGMGHSINVVVLFGLILAAGNVVDGAIVVTEYADRKMAEGLDRRRAYSLAVRRMAGPIFASTATQLAAFAPLLFWPGVAGEFMKFLPITQFAALTAALVMALIFVPVLGALVGRPNGPVLRLGASPVPGIDPAGTPPTGPYVAVLRLALRHPGKVLLLAVLLLVSIQGYYARHGNGVEFFPEIEPENAMVLVHARGNLSIDEQDTLVREVERRILALDDFASVYSRTGQHRAGFGRDLPPDVIGQITLEFKEWGLRRRAAEILEDVRRRTADLAGIVVELRKQKEGARTGKPVQVQLASRTPDLLLTAVEQVRRGMAEVGGFVDVEDTRPLPGIEWRIALDRAQAAKFGLDVSAVGDAVRLVTNGLEVGEFRSDGTSDGEIDIVVRYPVMERSLSALDAITVQTPAGAVPISGFVTRSAQPKVNQIDRIDGERVMTVRADVAPGALVDAKVRALEAWLEAHPLEPRVFYAIKGENEDQKESAVFLTKTFGVALALMAIILLTQFNSFYSCLLILSAVILSTIGVTVGLIVTGQPFSVVMTGVGIIALAGTVVQNNIVLIDTYDQYRTQGASEVDAIVRTGADRLRPVLLTALNTVLGLVPLSLGLNIDLLSREVTFNAPATQWWIQIATAIVFGLGFATVLTLVVTPSALMARANVRRWREERRLRRSAPSPLSGIANHFCRTWRSRGNLQPLTGALRAGITAAGPAEILDGMGGCDEADVTDDRWDQSPQWQKRPSEPALRTEEPVGARHAWAE